MDTVNEFRKLLSIDLTKFQFSDFDDIKELNKKSFKIANVFNGLKTDQQQSENDIENVENSQNKTIHLDDIPVKSSLSAKSVQSFEDLINKSLEKESSQNVEDKKISQPKKPFLRRGDGLKRFQTVSKPLSNTIEKAQESRRCIKALNLRNENCENAPIFSRKVISIPRHNSAQINVRRTFSPKKIIPKIPLSIPESSNEALCLKMQSFPQTQNEIRTNNTKYKTGSSFYEQFPENPIIRKKNIVSKIDQLEQRLLYLLNLKSNLLSTPLDKPKIETDEQLQVRDQEHDQKQNSQIEFNSEIQKSSPLEQLKKDIVSLHNQFASLEIQKQQEKWKQIQKQQKEKLQKTVIHRKNGKNIHGELNSDSDESEEAEVFRIPVRTIKKDIDAKTMVFKHKNGSISTIFPTGIKVIQYQNGQIEKIFPDDSKQIIYPDNQQKIIHSDKSEELHLSDGRIYSSFSDGTEKVQYPNGDFEVKTKDYTKRHFANGNIKTVYSNGYQETIYSNGRIRLKDNHGNVLCDKHC